MVNLCNCCKYEWDALQQGRALVAYLIWVMTIEKITHDKAANCHAQNSIIVKEAFAQPY